MDDLVRRVIGEIGRHPDAIKAAVAASNEQKSRSLRPLKSKLAELQRRQRELSDELQRYFQMARQSDSGHFGKEAMAAAEELARQKHEVEQGIEKVKIDIAYRERVVTDERLIARALLSFEKSTKALPFEEQRDLLRLLVRRIRVDRLDPEKDPIPSGPGTWKAQIRTQWYAVNLEFYTTDLIPTEYTTGGLTSQIAENGRGGQIRTDDILLPKQALYQAELRPVTRRTIRKPGRPCKAKAAPRADSQRREVQAPLAYLSAALAASRSSGGESATACTLSARAAASRSGAGPAAATDPWWSSPRAVRRWPAPASFRPRASTRSYSTGCRKHSPPAAGGAGPESKGASPPPPRSASASAAWITR